MTLPIQNNSGFSCYPRSVFHLKYDQQMLTTAKCGIEVSTWNNFSHEVSINEELCHTVCQEHTTRNEKIVIIIIIEHIF